MFLLSNLIHSYNKESTDIDGNKMGFLLRYLLAKSLIIVK